MAKRNDTNENEGVDTGEGASSIKIPRMNEQRTVFDFPCERQLLSEEMVIGKYSLGKSQSVFQIVKNLNRKNHIPRTEPFFPKIVFRPPISSPLKCNSFVCFADRRPTYIPFRAAGNGIVFIDRSLLVELYEKEANEKVSAGVFVDVPGFPSREEESFEDWKNNLQEYWKTEIGSFLEALYSIGEKKRFLVHPCWYVSVNWASLTTICTISDIAHDVFIQKQHEVQYTWHGFSD